MQAHDADWGLIGHVLEALGQGKQQRRTSAHEGHNYICVVSGVQ